jgi:hypothetical protein
LRAVELRIGPGVSEGEEAQARLAATVAGVAITGDRVTGDRLTEGTSRGRLSTTRGGSAPPPVDKVRFLGRVGDGDRLAALDAGMWVDDIPVASDPQRELLRWVREQAVSESRHRHGNVTNRRPGLVPGPDPEHSGDGH